MTQTSFMLVWKLYKRLPLEKNKRRKNGLLDIWIKARSDLLSHLIYDVFWKKILS